MTLYWNLLFRVELHRYMSLDYKSKNRHSRIFIGRLDTRPRDSRNLPV